MNNKNKKGIILMLSILLVIFIIILIVFIIYSPKPLKNDNTQPVEETISKNKSEKIKEEHCIESLCLVSTKISYDNKNKIGEIEFNFKNKGTESLPQGFIKLVAKDNPKISFVIYHLELNPDSEMPSLIQFKDKKIVEIKDFILKKPTNAEIEEAQRNLDLEK